MPPKDKKKGATKRKVQKPPWMLDEMFALTQDLPRLIEFYTGEDGKKGKKKSMSPPRRKDGKGGGAAEPPAIKLSKTQAALFIWQMLYPTSKYSKEKRDEAAKLQAVETSFKAMASGDPALMTPAAGILTTLVNTNIGRTVMVETRLTVLHRLLAALDIDSTPLAAAVCSLLRAMATTPELRIRLHKATKDWNWGPLCKCVGLQVNSHLGGRTGALDAVATLEAMCGAPEKDIANAACNAVVNCGGLRHIVQEMKSRWSHSGARSLGAALLACIMKRVQSEVCSDIIVGMGGLEPLVHLCGGGHDGTVALPFKAAAASCLLRYMLPDSVWNSPGAPLAPGLRPRTSEMQVSLVPPEGENPDEAQEQDPQGLPSPTSKSQRASSASAALPRIHGMLGPTSGGNPRSLSAAPLKLAWGGPAGLTSGPNLGAISTSVTAGLQEVTRQIGVALSVGTSRAGVSPVRDEDAMDSETKKEVLARAKVVAEAGAIPVLISLCAGPSGPLKDIEASGGESDGGSLISPRGGVTKKKKGKRGKKNQKLLPGMAEAQSYASACLRLISLGEEWRPILVNAGAVRFLTPLLQSRVNPARWNARQALLNLAMVSSLVPRLTIYKVPPYITSANIPVSHYERPFTAPSGNSELGLLASAALAAGSAVQRPVTSATPGGRFARQINRPGEVPAYDRLDGTNTAAPPNALTNSSRQPLRASTQTPLVLADRTGSMHPHAALLPLPNPGGGGLSSRRTSTMDTINNRPPLNSSSSLVFPSVS